MTLVKKIASILDDSKKSIRALLVLTFVAYLTSIFNDFVFWDDNELILENLLIRQSPGSNIKELFSTHVGGRYYPITLLAFQLEYFLFSFKPIYYHLVNIFLHLCNVALVFSLLNSLKINKKVVLLTAVFFAWHPLQVESVAWVSSLKDVLFCFFYLISVFFYLQFIAVNNNKKWFFYCMSIIFAGLSVFSKATGVSLPIVLLLIDYYFIGKIKKKQLFDKIPFFIIAGLCAGLTLYFADVSCAFPTSQASSLFDRIVFSSYAVFLYIAKLLWPVHLSCMYPLPDKLNGFYPLGVYASLALIPIFFVLVVFLYKRNDFRRTILPAFLFFLITLFPTLHFIEVNTGLIYERFVYLPSIGLFLIFVTMFQRFYSSNLVEKLKAKGVLRVLMIGYCLFLFSMTWNRGYVWNDSVTLFSDVIKKFPNSPNGYVCRSSVYSKMNKWDKAFIDVNRAISVSPNDSKAWSIRAGMNEYFREYEQAIDDYSKALELGLQYQPDIFKAYNNRGNLYSYQNKLELALSDYAQALALDPQNTYALLNRGVVYSKQNKYKESLADFELVLERFPDHPYAKKMRGVLLLKLGARDKVK